MDGLNPLSSMVSTLLKPGYKKKINCAIPNPFIRFCIYDFKSKAFVKINLTFKMVNLIPI